MGTGNDILGEKLLRVFLRELSQSDQHVDIVGCVNSAVELTTHPGEALEYLQALESKGSRIVSCGTCLDFHGLRDQLLIGDVGDMTGTVQLMATAERVIRPC